jgi:hypothetical protein
MGMSVFIYIRSSEGGAQQQQQQQRRQSFIRIEYPNFSTKNLDFKICCCCCCCCARPSAELQGAKAVVSLQHSTPTPPHASSL